MDIPPQLNVLGDPLEMCGTEPMTGFFRDGYANTGPQDAGSHTVCAIVTAEFLEHQQSVGNDLSTPRPEWHFPGLSPGDRWCVVAARWKQAYDDAEKLAAGLLSLGLEHEQRGIVAGLGQDGRLLPAPGRRPGRTR